MLIHTHMVYIVYFGIRKLIADGSSSKYIKRSSLHLCWLHEPTSVTK